MSEVQIELEKKMAGRNSSGWLRQALSGSDSELVEKLQNMLHTPTCSSAEKAALMREARLIMSDLWVRQVDYGRFYEDAALTRTPKDTLPVGFSNQEFYIAPAPRCFKLFLSEKNAQICADGLKRLLHARLDSTLAWANLRTLFYFDVDFYDVRFPSTQQLGLTSDAICFDVYSAQVEDCWDAIDKAATIIAAKSKQKIRIGIGQFESSEYECANREHLFGSRLPLGVGADWLLLKNIARRAGRYGWFWRHLARRQERFDNR